MTPSQDANERIVILPLSAARARLEAMIGEAQEGDPLAPVTVAGPSNYANLSLRHRLGRRGFANVRFMVFPRLAELLGAPSLAERGLRPLTPALEKAAVQTVAEEARGVLEAFRHHQALHQSLEATFRDMRKAAPEALDRLQEDGEPLHAEVARLYRRFLEVTATFYDPETLARAAATAVREGRAPGLRDLGTIIFYLPGNLSPGERAMAKALAEKSGGRFILGQTGDKHADEGVLELATALGVEPESTAHSQEDTELPTETRLLIAPDPHEEVRWVLRSVMGRAEEGTPLHRMAVLYRQTQPYARLLHDQCALTGIPIAGPAVGTLGETAVGRTLSGLLWLASGEMERDDVMEWLTACPVMPPSGAGGGFHPSQWDALSRVAGVVRGVSQWRDRLEHYAVEQARRASDPEVQERRSDASLARIRQEAKQARLLAGFVEALAADLEELPGPPSWQAYAEWALQLLDTYLDRRAAFPDVEVAARERIENAIRELPSVAPVRPQVTFDGFREAVVDLLAARSGHSGRTGEGLFVAPFGAARGMEFDRVFLVGMVEGAVPPRAVDDPLLPDWARRRASQEASAIPLRAARARDEQQAYLAALASAPKRQLSYPVGDPAAQRRLFPSRWLLEEASRLEGERVFTTSLERLGQRPWLMRVASREEGLRGVAEAAADVHDRDLRHLLAWREAGRPLRRHHLAAEPTEMGRALAMQQARAAAGLSSWDGDLSALAPMSRRLRPSGRQVLSPSRLQAWAKCPFQYFLASVLSIAALETPEDTEVISALDRGSLIHQVLERFLREAIAQGPPSPGEQWTPDHRTRLREIAHEEFRGAEERGITGRPLLWGLERESMLDDLDEFLRQDAALRAELGSMPWHVEMSFGFESEGPSLEGAGDSGLSLAFRGMIDRVDKTADGGALVLDYKTGGDYVYRGLDKDPVDRGKLLQLPVYGLAAQRALGITSPVRSAYWFVSARGGFALRPRQPLLLEDSAERFREAVGVIASGIGDGFFPANPGPDKRNCTYCDFDRLCAGRREAMWGRKRADQRIAAYLRLAEGDDEVGEEEQA